MRIPQSDWQMFVRRMSRINKAAGRKMSEYIKKHGFSDMDALIDYAHALITKYGEGAAELSCQMYDAIAELEGAYVLPAVPAEVATVGETAKALYGSLKQSPDGLLLESVIERLVKQAGADTTLQNAARDGARWAWIPSGDTCAFCITLASRGWQKVKGEGDVHAQHIHANCDCQYAVNFDGKPDVAGYDPQKYLKMYHNAAPNGSSQEKINALRRMLND